MVGKEDAEEDKKKWDVWKRLLRGRSNFIRSELPAPSGLCDKNKHAILANRDSICTEEVVHYHGRLLGCQVVLDQPARIGTLQKFNHKIPAPNVTNFRKG